MLIPAELLSEATIFQIKFSSIKTLHIWQNNYSSRTQFYFKIIEFKADDFVRNTYEEFQDWQFFAGDCSDEFQFSTAQSLLMDLFNVQILYSLLPSRTDESLTDKTCLLHEVFLSPSLYSEPTIWLKTNLKHKIKLGRQEIYHKIP